MNLCDCAFTRDDKRVLFEVLAALAESASRTHHQQTRILQELQRMSDQDTQLVAVTQELLTAYGATITALESEISYLKSVVVTPQTDQAVFDSIGNLQTLLAKMKADTAAAQAAIPAAPASADPTPAAPSSGSTDGSSDPSSPSSSTSGSGTDSTTSASTPASGGSTSTDSASTSAASTAGTASPDPAPAEPQSGTSAS